MAASSITKNFVIADKDDVEAFADALEKARWRKLPTQIILLFRHWEGR